MAPQPESCRMPFRNWDGQLVVLWSPKKSPLTYNRSNLCPSLMYKFCNSKLAKCMLASKITLWRLDLVGSTWTTLLHKPAGEFGPSPPLTRRPGAFVGPRCWAGGHSRVLLAGSLYFSFLPRWPESLPSLNSCLSSLRKVCWYFVCFLVYFLISIFRWKMICKTGKPFIS